MGKSVRRRWTAVVGTALCAATLAACARTTEGTVAMTTEPGPALSNPTASNPAPTRIPVPSLRPPGSRPDAPTVPAPPDSATMACSKYSTLDPPTQRAVIEEILRQRNNPLGPDAGEFATTLADAICQMLPSQPVSQVLLGERPR